VIHAKEEPMAEKRFKRVERPATAEERARHAAIRQQIQGEYPPAEGAGRQESPPGIPSRIRQAREARGLTWYALAKRAGIPNANTVRDVEYGRDAQLSTVQALARALGLRLELVEEQVGQGE
jgi:ribosome-binding protein aMBF1 (putative translation factor)